MSRFSELAGKGGRAAESRVARALQLLIPHPDEEPEFRTTARLILDNWTHVAALAPEGRVGHLSTWGMVGEEGGYLSSLLVEVAQSCVLGITSRVSSPPKLTLPKTRVIQPFANLGGGDVCEVKVAWIEQDHTLLRHDKQTAHGRT